MSEIKPCPFCNQPFEIVHSGGEGIYNGVLIKHNPNIDCPIEMDGENGYIYAQDELLNMLNTRPIEDQLKAENERLMEEIKQSNSLLRSAFMIAKRDGKETNWEAFRGQLDIALERQHKMMYRDAEQALKGGE